MKNINESILEFEKLPYLEKPYSSRLWGHPLHSLCSYQSKLKPAIAFFLTKIFVDEGDLIFEPFSGAGTISFELAQKGIRTISLDLNSVAYTLTSAKLNPQKKEIILTQIKELEDYIKNSKLSKKDLEYADDYIKRFYHEETLNEILKAKKFFYDKKEDYNFLKSCLLHILHGNRPYALSRTSHNITPYAPRGDFIYKNLIKSITEKVERMYSKPISENFRNGEVFQGSIFDFSYPEKFDKIITSPPFVNSTRFIFNNRIRMWFNGESYKEQVKRADEFVENYDINIFKKIMKKLSSLLKDNGICIMHLGVVKNVDMGKELSKYAEEDGFKTIKLIYEDVKGREKFGIRDQGATHKHQFLILKKIKE